MKVSCCWMYAISKYGYPPVLPDMIKAIHEMKEMGFNYIELEGLGYENINDVVQNKHLINKACKDAGVEVSNFAVILPDVVSTDKAQQEKAFEAFKKGVEVAALVESPFVWIDSYAPPLEVKKGSLMTTELVFGQQISVRVPDSFSWVRFWDNFVAAVARCTEIVRSAGMDLLVEPRVGEITSNTEALLRLAEAVNDRHFGIIFDTAHLHAQKELLPLSVHKLGDLLRYVHVGDNDSRDNHHYEMGKGTIDWDEVFRSLKQIDYQGFFATDIQKAPDLVEQFLRTKEKIESYGKKHGLA